jgi:FAD/FMN-containing dehydrogenase
MLTTGLQRIRRFDPVTGIVTVEPGCQMSQLDQELRRHHRELRLLPSTWRSATVGGFVAGGSGGIGSIRWGFLRDPGHLLGLEVVPMTTDAHCHQLDEVEAEALNHSYGTNGIITALTLSTAPAVNWHQVCIDCMDWADAVALLLACGRSAVSLQLATALEASVLERLPGWSGPAKGASQVVVVGGPGWHRKPEAVGRSCRG